MRKQLDSWIANPPDDLGRSIGGPIIRHKQLEVRKVLL